MTGIVILLVLLANLFAIGMIARDMWRMRGDASMLVIGGLIILLLAAMAFLLIATLVHSST